MPRILFVDHPAVLVSLDGAPQLQLVEGSSVMRVVNTPVLMAFDSATKRYYLDAGESWFVAGDVEEFDVEGRAVCGEVERLVLGGLFCGGGKGDVGESELEGNGF